MKRAFITRLAESDLSKIWHYIARDSPQRADEFIDEIRAECHRLAAEPHRGRLREQFAENLRSYRFGNYFIFYFPTETGIEVARVVHGARDLPRLF